MASFAFFRQVGSAGSVTDLVVNVDHVITVNPSMLRERSVLVLAGSEIGIEVRGDLTQVVETLRAAVDSGGLRVLRSMDASLAKMAEETSY